MTNVLPSHVDNANTMEAKYTDVDTHDKDTTDQSHMTWRNKTTQLPTPSGEASHRLRHRRTLLPP